MILVSGSICYDTIISTVGKFVDNRRGTEQHYSYSLFAPRIVREPGGTGHNVAYTLGLLGYKDETVLVGSVGKDFVITEKLAHTIDYTHVTTDMEALTGGAYIINDEHNNQIISFHPGALSSGLRTLPHKSYKYFIVTPNDKDIMMAHIQHAKDLNATVFFDPGQQLGMFNKQELTSIFAMVDYLICNDEEATVIAKLFEVAIDAVSTLCQGVIITKGAKGVDYHDTRMNISGSLPAYSVDQAIDPTGAGDAFRGAMLAGLMAGETLETALGYGVIVGGIAVTHQGTMNHSISMTELKEKHRLYTTT